MRVFEMKGKMKTSRSLGTETDYKPRAIDLFCGCGGLTVGLKRSGFRVIGAVDIDPTAIASYKANHREVKVWKKDITDLTISSVKRRLKIHKGEIDLVAGCPPCQGFTSLRTLNGSREVNDPRNDLLFEFQRFVKYLRPKVVMMENVPELAKDKRFAEFKKALEQLGYIGDYKILDAADYGVPQRRERLIYMASLGTAVSFAKECKRRRTVHDAIFNLPRVGASKDALHDIAEHRTTAVMNKIHNIPHNGGSRTDLPDEDQLPCHRRCTGFKDIYGRMAWNKPAPTITSGCFNPSKGRFIHPEEDRAITMREAALLQGFPRHYKFRGTKSKSTIALMIGNALPPPFIAAHARMIRKVLRNHINQSA